MSFVYSHPFTGLANGLQTMNAAGGGIGGWVELGRTTLGGTSDNLAVSSLSDKRYYMVLTDVRATGGNVYDQLRFNDDTGSNYAWRRSGDGGADGTSSSDNDMLCSACWGLSTPGFGVNYIANLSAQEKLIISHTVNQLTAGAGTAPSRYEYSSKHAQTSNPISKIDWVNADAGDYASGSEVVVLGWDPADTHTNNFWEELASVNSTNASSFDSGTFTAKKYLWIQAFIEGDGSDAGSTNTVFRVGNSTIDTGSNYAKRSSTNGGADGTATSTDDIGLYTGSAPRHHFLNIFIINNASNEKLIIGNEIDAGTAGAANAPNRLEFVGKWANTSNQINIVGFNTDSAEKFSTTTQLKVWGAD